eukprot:UN01218
MAQSATQTRMYCNCGVIVGEGNLIINVGGLEDDQKKGDKLKIKSCAYHDDRKHKLMPSAQSQSLDYNIQSMADSINEINENIKTIKPEEKTRWWWPCNWWMVYVVQTIWFCITASITLFIGDKIDKIDKIWTVLIIIGIIQLIIKGIFNKLEQWFEFRNEKKERNTT